MRRALDLKPDFADGYSNLGNLLKQIKQFAGAEAAYRDAEGYFYFVGRADDVIISAGWTMSAVEIENTLLKHPDVREAAAIGVPDPLKGETIKAFVQVRADHVPSDALAAALIEQLVGEAAELAKQFIEEAISKHQVPPGQLTIHADRGRVMKSKPVAFLMADLGVTKSHSRPYVSDDNPYSESQFRTMKYRPDFPDRFGCIRHRLTHTCCGSFWRDPDRPGPPPGGARYRLSSAPGPLRSAAAQTDAVALGGLDQQAAAIRRKDKGR